MFLWVLSTKLCLLTKITNFKEISVGKEIQGEKERY